MVSYDEERDEFALTVHGKNGLFVDNEAYFPNT